MDSGADDAFMQSLLQTRRTSTAPDLPVIRRRVRNVLALCVVGCMLCAYDAFHVFGSTLSFRAQRLPPLVIACLAATWVVWGSTYLAIKFALVSFPPYLQMGSRFLVAGVALALWMRFARQAPWPNPRQWLHAALACDTAGTGRDGLCQQDGLLRRRVDGAGRGHR